MKPLMKEADDNTSTNLILLEESQIKNSRQYIKKHQNLPQYQNTYQLILGCFGLQNWINQYYLDVDFYFDQQALLNESKFLFTPFFNQLIFGQFTASLVLTEDYLSDFIIIPKIAVDLPQFSTHFYIAVDILEESGEVIILGLVRRDEIVRSKKNIQYSETEQGYIVPISAFDSDFASLYTYVKYLNPQKIPLPEALPEKDASIIASLERKIASFLNQPKLEESYIWEYLQLTWAETSAFFERGDLLESIKNSLLKTTLSQEINNELKTTLKAVSQKAINLFTWFEDQLDSAAKFLTTPESAYQFIGGGVRDAGEDLFKDIVDQLVSEQRIPLDDSRIIKIPFNLQGFDFEILVCVWADAEGLDKEEWSFLCILKPNTALYFPRDTRLKISLENGDTDAVIMSPEDMFYPTVLKTEFRKSIMLDIGYQDEHYIESFVFSPSENESSFRSNFIQLTTHYFIA